MCDGKISFCCLSATGDTGIPVTTVMKITKICSQSESDFLKLIQRIVNFLPDILHQLCWNRSLKNKKKISRSGTNTWFLFRLTPIPYDAPDMPQMMPQTMYGHYTPDIPQGLRAVFLIPQFNLLLLFLLLLLLLLPVMTTDFSSPPMSVMQLLFLLSLQANLLLFFVLFFLLLILLLLILLFFLLLML